MNGGRFLWATRFAQSAAPRECPIHPATDQSAAETAAGHFLETVRRTAQNGIRGALTAADRRSDSFAQIASRKTGGIADDEGVADAGRIERPAHVVAVARRISRHGNLKLPQ